MTCFIRPQIYPLYVHENEVDKLKYFNSVIFLKRFWEISLLGLYNIPSNRWSFPYTNGSVKFTPNPQERGLGESGTSMGDVILLSRDGFEAGYVAMHQASGTQPELLVFLIVNYGETCEEQETHVRQIFSNRPGGVGWPGSGMLTHAATPQNCMPDQGISP